MKIENNTVVLEPKDILVGSPKALSPEVPLERSGSRTNTFLFWGTATVVLAALAQFMSGPGQSYSVAIFIDDMLLALKVNRTEFSIAYGIATLIGGFSLPFIGKALDKFGARIMLPLVALLLGLSCYGMSMVSGLLGIFICFAAIRSLGQGTLTLISTWMVSEWFAKRRGLATAIISVGGTASVFAFPHINSYVLDRFDWRMGWVVCAALVAGSLIIPGILFVRNRPEELGLKPDGLSAEQENLQETTSKPETVQEHLLPDSESFTLAEAIKTTEFWKVSCVMGTSAMLGTGLNFHQISLLDELDISKVWAVNLIGFQAIVATLANLCSGYLCDKNYIRGLLISSMIGLTCCVSALLLMPVSWFVLFYSGFLGCQGGILRSAGTVIWPNYFGRLHQGAIRGMALSIMIVAAALGAIPLAISKDMTGQYQLGLLFLLVLPILSGFWVATLKRPSRGLNE